MRRNPVIADLFHRMKYMERRGSGLRKIVSETEKLPGYTEAYKPEFSSTATDFRVILKNVNYHLSQKDLVSDQDCDQVSDQDKSQDILHAVLDFCITEKSKQEICSFIGYRNLTYFTRKYLNPLLASGQLKMTIPDKPNSRKQKYITVRSEQTEKQGIGSHLPLSCFFSFQIIFTSFTHTSNPGSHISNPAPYPTARSPQAAIPSG